MHQKVTVTDLADSKVFVSEKNAIFKFQHPMEYLQPVMDILDPYGVAFDLRAVQGSVSQDKESVVDGVSIPGKEYISYSRLISRAKLPEAYDIHLDTNTEFSDLTSEIGFVFGLDIAAPEIKVYSGKRVTVCDNGCIFGADSVTSFNLLKSTDNTKIYDTLKSYADNAAKGREMYINRIEQLRSNKLTGKKLMERIGHVMWEVKKNSKLGVTIGTEMLTLLQNNKTRYFIDEDTVVSDWHLYNACTEPMKKVNILDEASKVKLLDDVFSIQN